MKILFRPCRGLLSEAMAEVQEVETFEDIKKIVWNDLHEKCGYAWKPETEDYGFDDRINWETWIVFVKGYGPVGYTNGEIKA